MSSSGMIEVNAVWIIHINSVGAVNVRRVSELGGVQFLGLCYKDINGRGLVSGSNSGSNTTYYLYNAKWFRTISADNFNLKDHIIHVSSGGYLENALGSDTGGGVPIILVLC